MFFPSAGISVLVFQQGCTQPKHRLVHMHYRTFSDSPPTLSPYMFLSATQKQAISLGDSPFHI
jgi:hypothetical protein